MAWIVAATEIFVHLVIAQAGAEFGYEFWVALIVVIGVANLLPYWLTITIWHAHLRGNDCYASPYWAPLQIFSALSFFVLMGGGFFVAPAALALDGVLRLSECLPEERSFRSVNRDGLQEI